MYRLSLGFGNQTLRATGRNISQVCIRLFVTLHSNRKWKGTSRKCEVDTQKGMLVRSRSKCHLAEYTSYVISDLHCLMRSLLRRENSCLRWVLLRSGFIMFLGVHWFFKFWMLFLNTYFEYLFSNTLFEYLFSMEQHCADDWFSK